MIKPGAVITADIVNSKKLGPDALNNLTTRIRELLKENRVRFLSFYRGDSFQCYCSDPYPAFKIALKLRCEAKIFQAGKDKNLTDLKISLGIGSIDAPVTSINKAMGQAFIISGEELDRLESKARKFIIKSENPELNIAFDAISFFTDFLFSNLTVKQAEVLQHLLNNLTQMRIANILKKSQSTINRHVQALGWNELEHLLDLYNQCILKITQPHG